jgi:hypothetical protein
MSKANLQKRLNRAYELTLSIKGRKSGKDIPRPVWFVNEGSTLYLLPVQGTDTNWYKNFQANQTLKVSVNGEEISTKGKPITDNGKVRDVVTKFSSKYGDGGIRKYYPKHDVAVEAQL